MKRTALLLAALCFACAERNAPEITVFDVSKAAAGNPTAAANADGAWVAWVEMRDSVSDVYIARVDSAGSAEDVRVNDIRGDAAPHNQAPPQVEIAPDGTVYVLWQNNTIVPGRRFAASNLRLARSTDGGRTFEPAVFVNDDAAGSPTSHTFQDIDVGADGTVYVSWLDGRSGAGSDVRVAKSTDGGRTFDSGTIVAMDVCPCCRTSLAVRGETVFVSFRSQTDNIRDIVVARSTDGGRTFGAPAPVHADGWVIDGCPHSGASLTIDGAGYLHVAWYTGAEGRQGVWHAVSTDGGATFSAPESLTTGGFVPVSQVKTATDAQGTVWIAWDDRTTENHTVRLALARPGRPLERQEWSAPGHSPAIAAGESVVVTWQSGSSVRGAIVR